MKNSKLLVSLVPLASCFFVLYASAATENFTLSGKAPSGTLIKPVDAVSKIPFNKRFSEMTKMQQAQIINSHPNLAEGATPPFPQRGTRSIYKPLIKKGKQLATHGKLVMSAVVDEQGKVESVTVRESADPQLAEYADWLLRRTKFDPAMCNQQACKMEYFLNATFQ